MDYDENTAINSLALAGINTGAVLARFSGDSDLLLRTLHIFSTSFKTFGAELNESIANGDADATARLAHTLKGSAGNVGADEIQRLAAQFETELQAGHSQSSEKLLAALDRLLTQLDNIHEHSLPQTQAEPADSPRADIDGRLDELEVVLSRSMAVPPELITIVTELTRVPSVAARAGRLVEQINEFDYENAILNLKEIKKELH